MLAVHRIKAIDVGDGCQRFCTLELFILRASAHWVLHLNVSAVDD